MSNKYNISRLEVMQSRTKELIYFFEGYLNREGAEEALINREHLGALQDTYDVLDSITKESKEDNQ